MCVLIVEDDDDLRRVVGNIVVDAGYAVLYARHGAEALETLQTAAPPCLILSDVEMPVMDGIELAERVRTMPRLAHVTIVFLTASLSRVPVGLSVLAKPVDLDELLATLAWAHPCRA